MQLLLTDGPATQADISRLTGLSPATVSNIVRALHADGRVDISAGRGRRAITLKPMAGVVAGIDFGHRHVRVAIADRARVVLAEDVHGLDEDYGADEGLELAVSMTGELLRRVGAEPGDLQAVAVGVPGPIDASTGTVGSSVILPGWIGVDPAAVLRDRFPTTTVYVDNDANLGALGEVTWGAGRGHSDVAYIKAATGIGGALVLGGRIFRGRAGTAGEIGHLTVDENGRVCRCGNRGCLETFVGTPGLVQLLPPTGGDTPSLQELLQRAAAGDPGCRRVLEDAGRHLGVAVAILANLISPELVVLGGDLAAAGALVVDPLRDTVRRSAIPAAAHALQVTVGRLGPRAELLGAIALAVQGDLSEVAATRRLLARAGHDPPPSRARGGERRLQPARPTPAAATP